MNIVSIVFAGIGTALACAYCVLLIKSSATYTDYIQGLPNSKYIMKVIYPVGFYLFEVMHYPYTMKLDKKRLQQCKVLHGEHYGEYYFRLNYAQKLSMVLLILPICFFAFALMPQPVILILSGVGAMCAYYYYDMQITDVMNARKVEIERDIADILSKLTLLINAGMIMSEAWIKVSDTGKSTLYQDMKIAMVEIQNGTPEGDAYMNFANRSMNVEVKKIMSLIVQNISKGNKELTDFLKQQTILSWEEKKHSVRKQGEEATSKLMIPTIIMFAGIMILVVVPIFANFSF